MCLPAVCQFSFMYYSILITLSVNCYIYIMQLLFQKVLFIFFCINRIESMSNTYLDIDFVLVIESCLSNHPRTYYLKTTILSFLSKKYILIYLHLRNFSYASSTIPREKHGSEFSTIDQSYLFRISHKLNYTIYILFYKTFFNQHKAFEIYPC